MADMTLAEALLWLNDRLGKGVDVSVELELGDRRVTVLEGSGILQHWSEASDRRSFVNPRDDLAGWYRAGETLFDLTEVAHAQIRRGDDVGEIVIELSVGVTLRILELQEFHP